MRKILVRSLNAAGVATVAEADSGSEALKKFKAGGYDLVLTDWEMPGRNGLELVESIRKLDAQVPIIMVSAQTEKSQVVQAIQAGVTDYLVKPFTADTLREKLQKHGC